MIYFYEYINPKITKGQSFVNYVILEVLFRSHKAGMPNIFDENAVINKYKGIVNVNQAHIKKPLNDAYQICKNLNSVQRKKLKRGLFNNLDIKGLCDGTVKPILFSDIKLINKDLANSLYIFSKNLYKEVLKLKPFTDLYGPLMEHYNEFSVVNGFKSKRCPFCGSARMLNEYNSKKEAYDHFFPKEQYPFISIHFMNLAPMCHTCNSSYKSRKNPIDIQKTGVSKKVFYPYFPYGRINHQIKISNMNIGTLIKNDITITNTLINHNEEIESWEEIFGIDERYKSIYIGDSLTWFEEVRIATNTFGETYSNYKTYLDDHSYSDENFMKLALLLACEKIALISA